MARSNIFQARTTHSLQHPAHNRLWTKDIYYFSNRPTHGPPNNWQTCLFLPPEAKYLPWLFRLPRQNICRDYFAFCGTRLVEVVVSCDKYNIQGDMLRLVHKPKTPNLTLWHPAAFRDFRKIKHLNARGFAQKYLLSRMGYGPGWSVKRRGMSCSLHSKNNFLLGEAGFFVSDIISRGILGNLAHFAWPWAQTVRW